MRQKNNQSVPERNKMTPDLEKLRAHADAVDALIADSATRLTALSEAQQTITGYDRSPMREMALQGLARAIGRMEQSQSTLPSYSRTLRLYIGEVEKKSQA